MKTKFPHKNSSRVHSFSTADPIKINGMEVLFDQEVDMVSTELISNKPYHRTSGKAVASKAMTIVDKGSSRHNAKGYYNKEYGIYEINFDYSSSDVSEVNSTIKDTSKRYYKDTAWGISNRFGLNRDEFARMNGADSFSDLHLTGKTHLLIDDTDPQKVVQDNWEAFKRRDGFTTIDRAAKQELSSKDYSNLYVVIPQSELLSIFDRLADDTIKTRIINIEQHIVKSNRASSTNDYTNIMLWANYYKAMEDGYIKVYGAYPMFSQKVFLYVEDQEKLENWVESASDGKLDPVPNFNAFYHLKNEDIYSVRKQLAEEKDIPFTDTYKDYVPLNQYLIFFPFQYTVISIIGETLSDDEIRNHGTSNTLPEREREYNRIYREEGAFMAGAFKFGLGLFEASPITKMVYAIRGRKIMSDEHLDNIERLGYGTLAVIDIVGVGLAGKTAGKLTEGGAVIQGVAQTQGIVSKVVTPLMNTGGGVFVLLGHTLMIGSKGALIYSHSDKAIKLVQLSAAMGSTILLGYQKFIKD